MQEWYLTLDPTMQVFWGCAIISSVVFAVQAILTLIGMDAHDAMDLDIADGDTMDVGGGLSLFSIRSLVNFFVGFGWAGVSFANDISSKALLYFVAIVIGLAFAYAYVFMRRKLQKLESNGAYKIADCVGKTADVYLRIPEKGKGKGKIQISINGSIHELDAISNGEEIPTGAKVKVEAVEGSTVCVVPQ